MKSRYVEMKYSGLPEILAASRITSAESEGGIVPNIVSLGASENSIVYRGSFLVAPVNMDAFYENVCKKVWSMRDGGSVAEMNLAEIPDDATMLVVDADIKVPIELVDERTVDSMGKLYTDETIENVIRAYQTVMRKSITMWDHSAGYDDVVVLEKPEAYIETRGNQQFYKSGFHLAFPNIFYDIKNFNDCQTMVFIKSELSKSRTLEKYGIKNDAEIIDAPNAKRAWLMYGSCKSLASGIYRATKGFGTLISGDLEPKTFEEIFRVNERRIRLKTPDENKEYVYLDASSNCEYYLPWLLSIHPHDRPVVKLKSAFDTLDYSGMAQEEIEEKIFSPDRAIGDEEFERFRDKKLSIGELFATCKKLLDMLNVERATDYNLWSAIGRCLASIFVDGEEEGYELWDEFSRRCPEKYDENAVKDVWRRSIESVKRGKNQLTIGFLKSCAKKDSPDEYHEITRNTLLSKLKTAARERSDGAIARYIYSAVGSTSLKFTDSGGDDVGWYVFGAPGAEHIWSYDPRLINLRQMVQPRILRDIKKELRETRKEIKGVEEDQSLTDAQRRAKKESLDKFAYHLHLLIKDIDSVRKFRSIIEALETLCYDRDFLRRAGRNPELIACLNGVWDCENHYLRDGVPGDDLVRQMPVEYIDYSKKQDDVYFKKVVDMIETLHVNENIRNYFLDRTAELLRGGNFRKSMYIWTGAANNGKSAFKKLLSRLFGDYMVDIPNSILTDVKAAMGKAVPELARTDAGVRIAVTQELKSSDTINTGQFKELTGGDSMYVRGLYSKGKEIEPLYKLIMICNDMPQMSTVDPACWIRVRVIPWESTFTDKATAPKDRKEQFRRKIFPLDDTLSASYNEMKTPLFWILTERLKRLERNGDENYPPEIREATNRYREEQDVFIRWIKDMVVDTGKEEDVIDDYVAYHAFKDWCKSVSNLSFRNIPSRPEFIKYLTEQWRSSIVSLDSIKKDGKFTPGKRYWRGFIIKDDMARGSFAPSFAPSGNLLDANFKTHMTPSPSITSSVLL